MSDKYKKIFREYDIRGIYEEDLDIYSSYYIGYYLGEIVIEKTRALRAGADSADEVRIGIGYDARISGKTLFKYLASGLIDAGVRVYDLGMVPTPTSYFANYHEFANPDAIKGGVARAVGCYDEAGDAKEIEIEEDSSIKASFILDATLMITGSHNPKEYNGYKITINKAPFFGEDIRDLGGLVCERLNSDDARRHVDERTLEIWARVQAFDITLAPEIPHLDILRPYIDYMCEHFSALKDFPYKVAIDAGNGVAGLALLPILQRLGISYYPLYCEVDANFPNHHPDPSVLANLKDLQRVMSIDEIPLGLAFDGDADRVRFITNSYVYEGDELAILFSDAIASKGISPTVIGEVKCSKKMYDYINTIGKAIMHKTGHSNLKVKLRDEDATFAAEMSGHIFFNDRYFGYDDGIYAGLRALELCLDKSPSALEEFISLISTSLTTPEIKIQSTEEEKFAIIKELKGVLCELGYSDIIDIDGIRLNFPDGFALLRASNTTPTLVARYEADKEENLEKYKALIAKALGMAKSRLS